MMRSFEMAGLGFGGVVLLGGVGRQAVVVLARSGARCILMTAPRDAQRLNTAGQRNWTSELDHHCCWPLDEGAVMRAVISVAAFWCPVFRIRAAAVSSSRRNLPFLGGSHSAEGVRYEMGVRFLAAGTRSCESGSLRQLGVGNGWW
ncbi:hypothetical protein PLESTB_000997600 [Pleodorina starrii]|uniref:Uncharacterized protein n=1 Tax=Pleodorina starrii TaxID=330485 RepID=A0A9W6F4M7_9CHLO|nr:hypothetical protein PLESTM_001856600 [Pleodorina starrii]GLC55531.1 hypothetical protein PLESTB_000997600 [Pleodorina starrii]